MFRGTTPTIRWYITTEEIDFDKIERVWMTFKDCCGRQINFTEEDIVLNGEERYVQFTFSQEETLKLKAGYLRVQLRMLLSDGQALASAINEIKVENILKGGII